MTGTIYSDIISSATNQNMVIVDNVMERMAASVGGHVLNLANLDHRIFLEKNKCPRNFRIHIVYVAPSGWTKSTYFRLLLRSSHGLLSNPLFPTDVHSSFSLASWMGTNVKDDSGQFRTKPGIFEKYKTGIVGADDYQALKLLLEGEGIEEDERALITALDTDEMVKNLSSGQIRVEGIGTTCWFGMRPCAMKLTSGLARRLTFPRYFPTRKEAEEFKRLNREDIEPAQGEDQDPCAMPETLKDTYSLVEETGKVTLCMEEVNEFLSTYKMPHFEENIYRNLAIGFSVANGCYPDIHLGETGEALLRDEILSREILRSDPFRMMFYRILSDEPDRTIKLSSLRYFMKAYLQFTEKEADYLIAAERLGERVKVETVDGQKMVTGKWEPDYMAQVGGKE